ncbi:MAG: hypothetical protein ACTTKL_00295 [Treponema sp.]
MKKILGIAAGLLCAHAAVFAVEIETAMAQTAEQFSKTLKAGSTIAIIGISSDTEEMSDFMLDELTVNFVKQRKLKVADRANLAAIKKEMNFQLSGEVGDDSIQQIGAMAGAQTVIRGNLKPLGGTYLLVIHALNVTTAAVEDIYRERIDVNETMQLLLSSSKRKSVKQSGGSKIVRSDRYHGGELAGIGFSNILFGMGSYRVGEKTDGIILSAWHTANLGMFIGGIAAFDIGVQMSNDARNRQRDSYGGSGYNSDARRQKNEAGDLIGTGIALLTVSSISGISAIVYGFVRPKFYTKRPKNGGMSTLDVLSGFNLAFVPLENGDIAPSLSYSISF